MANLAVQTDLDAETYLAWAERQTEKHEFIDGELFAMVEARREHVVVSASSRPCWRPRPTSGC